MLIDFRLAALPTARLPRFLPLLLLGATLAGAAVLVGCGDTAETAPDATYETRGIVRQLPDAELPGSELTVHHEAIATFVDSSGETVGMDSMAMPFPVGDDAMLADLEVGDRIRMVFQVDWDGSPPIVITELEELPESTVLDFEEGRLGSFDFESGDLEDVVTESAADSEPATDTEP